MNNLVIRLIGLAIYKILKSISPACRQAGIKISKFRTDGYRNE